MGLRITGPYRAHILTDTTLLRCIDAPEANHLMEEMHEGLLRAHASGPLLA